LNEDGLPKLKISQFIKLARETGASRESARQHQKNTFKENFVRRLVAPKYPSTPGTILQSHESIVRQQFDFFEKCIYPLSQGSKLSPMNIGSTNKTSVA